tara:strand:+ start:250 stop:1164 length:915 start_codon:yes stop_codon:yes gene_type:complete
MLKTNYPYLCLGSAQFGMQYGITNKSIKPTENDIFEILKLAKKSKIKFIDTAENYGNSEEIIGNCISREPALNFEIITKLGLDNNQIWEDSISLEWDKRFLKSLSKLNLTSVNSYLIHNPLLLYRNDFEILLNWLISLKKRKLVKRIGISIYTEKDIEKINLKDIDIIQLPLSIYDQRMINNGVIKSLKNYNVDIHIRSIFLQGLMLQRPENWPKFISERFRNHHFIFCNEIKKYNISLLEASLIFAKNIKDIECILIGIGNIKELREILHIWEKINNEKRLDFNDFSWQNLIDLDPRNWNHKN